jgi:2-dehydro-3-deoxy-D-arabinonate dehydratase
MTSIVRYRNSTGDVRLSLDDGGHFPSGFASLADLLQLTIADFRAAVENVGDKGLRPGQLLAPLDGQTEVWAAGVTYKRSEEARVEESATPDIYSRVYRAERPELFFKATARRVAGPDAPIVVRSDSTWDVPEPEVAIVVNAHAEIVGYTIGNDVSSRSIEGDNPLYLPQAKVYLGSCALGPGIVPAWQVADPYALGIRMRIVRGGALHWQGETSMREFARRLDDLVAYLFREDEFPDGVILVTGTALVPDSPFTLEAGDLVEIEIDGLGTLRNPVVRGKSARVLSP